MDSTVEDSAISSMSFHLFTEVENASEIRAAIFSAKIPICLVQPQLVWDEFQLRSAIAKTLQNQADGTMKTRTFATEILYWLSPSTNISDSLKTFGAGDDAKEMLFISQESDYQQVQKLVKGVEIPIDGIINLRDSDRISASYGLNDVGEMYKNSKDLQSSFIVSRMMTKELC